MGYAQAQLEQHSPAVQEENSTAGPDNTGSVSRKYGLSNSVRRAGLRVGAADDASEREADQIASAVMGAGSRLHEQDAAMESAASDAAASGIIQRSAEDGAEEGSFDAGPELAEDMGRSAAQSIDAAASSYIGSRLGADFSDVKVHTDRHAERVAMGMSARAFTRGKDIYFNRGQYNPGTAAGQELLAHELTHTIQQGQVSQEGGIPVTQTASAQTAQRGFFSLRKHFRKAVDERNENYEDYKNQTRWTRFKWAMKNPLAFVFGRLPANKRNSKMRIARRDLINSIDPETALLPGESFGVDTAAQQGEQQTTEEDSQAMREAEDLEEQAERQENAIETDQSSQENGEEEQDENMQELEETPEVDTQGQEVTSEENTQGEEGSEQTSQEASEDAADGVQSQPEGEALASEESSAEDPRGKEIRVRISQLSASGDASNTPDEMAAELMQLIREQGPGPGAGDEILNAGGDSGTGQSRSSIQDRVRFYNNRGPIVPQGAEQSVKTNLMLLRAAELQEQNKHIGPKNKKEKDWVPQGRLGKVSLGTSVGGGVVGGAGSALTLLGRWNETKEAFGADGMGQTLPGLKGIASFAEKNSNVLKDVGGAFSIGGGLAGAAGGIVDTANAAIDAEDWTKSGDDDAANASFFDMVRGLTTVGKGIVTTANGVMSIIGPAAPVLTQVGGAFGMIGGGAKMASSFFELRRTGKILDKTENLGKTYQQRMDDIAYRRKVIKALEQTEGVPAYVLRSLKLCKEMERASEKRLQAQAGFMRMGHNTAEVDRLRAKYKMVSGAAETVGGAVSLFGGGGVGVAIGAAGTGIDLIGKVHSSVKDTKLKRGEVDQTLNMDKQIGELLEKSKKADEKRAAEQRPVVNMTEREAKHVILRKEGFVSRSEAYLSMAKERVGVMKDLRASGEKDLKDEGDEMVDSLGLDPKKATESAIYQRLGLEKKQAANVDRAILKQKKKRLLPSWRA